MVALPVVFFSQPGRRHHIVGPSTLLQSHRCHRRLSPGTLPYNSICVFHIASSLHRARASLLDGVVVSLRRMDNSIESAERATVVHNRVCVLTEVTAASAARADSCRRPRVVP